MADDERGPAFATFDAEVLAKAAQMGKVCMMLEPLDLEDSEDEEEMAAVTVEQLRALGKIFMPEAAEDKLQEVQSALYTAGDSDCDDESCGRMTTTRSSYGGQEVLDTYIRRGEAALRKKDAGAALQWALAVTMAGLNDRYWYRDTDAVDVVEALAKRLFSVWKRVLKHSDAELDVGAEDRAGVKSMLERFKEELQDASFEVPAMPRC